MNVLTAATPGLDTAVERALAWATAAGATTVHRADTAAGTVTIAGELGGAATFHPLGTGAAAGLGPHAAADIAATSPPTPPGDTVAVLLDERRLTVHAGAGHQRLFTCELGEGRLFSTHVGALVAALDSAARTDRRHEDFLLGFGFLPDGRTPFRGLVAVERPSVLAFGADRATVTPRSDVVTAEDEMPPSPSVDLADLLVDVVDEQAGGARTVGVLLGGFDSALVAAALHRTGRDVHTFTFSFREPGYVQHNIDAAVAAARATHHWVEFTPDVLGGALLDLPVRLNQPGPQPHYQLQTIIAGEAARDVGVDAIFTGDGCDALFAAYPTVNSRAAVTSRLQRIPASARRGALAILQRRAVERRLGHVARMGRSALTASLLPGVTGRHLPSQYLDDTALRRLRTDAAPEQTEPIDEIRRRLAADVPTDDASRLAHHGHGLTGQSQAKVEGLVSSTGRVVTSPFTHPRFRAEIASLPDAQRRPDGKLYGAEGKPVLQEAAERAGLLPPEVIYQPKQAPTEAPIDDWYAGPLRSTIVDLIADVPFDVDWTYVDEILRPKRAEDAYRRHIAVSRYAFHAIGLLSSYGAFTRMVAATTT